MENKQTAVEWLDRWFRDNPEATHEEGNKALQQAKEMECEQIIDAYKKYQSYLIEEFLIQERTYKGIAMHKPFEGNSKTFEQWIETYGSKGSDELGSSLEWNEEVTPGSDWNFKQFSLYEHKETIATANTLTSSQTENKGLDWLVSHWKKLQSEGEKMNWEQIIKITELAKEVQSSQTEISDEEIEEQANKYVYDDHVLFVTSALNQKRYGFADGAKWYREQLKSM